MASTLQQVLDIFEQNTGRPLSVRQVAQALDIEMGMLESMLHYWVRKGKLREVGGDAAGCAGCGASGGCLLAAHLPKCYERGS
ncbi:MAG: hypothetical protein JXB47_15305 [Anaerolineae bacterium]|nr:hypothetical protein [Anaerolineae bacterium]